jgi:hypothetical protein
MNKKLSFVLITSILFSVVCAVGLFADDGTAVYVEGWVDLRDSSGDLWELYIGDPVENGDTVITSDASYAEIEQGDYSTIRISPNTVFTLLEKETGGEKQSVYNTALGSARFKISKTFGREPSFTTPSVVAGVRGTEFTVFSGPDGSSFIAVESGMVEVSSEGESVELGTEEGVEVRPGEPPGEKVTVKRGELDFSAWNAQKNEQFFENPAGAAERVDKQLKTLIGELQELVPVYEQRRAKIETEREKLKKIEEEQGKDARQEYYQDTVFPLEVNTSYMRMNIRYYALSALSLRRYVMGRMYVAMKSKYITDLQNKNYTRFEEVYTQFLTRFEKGIVPYLVEADI